MRETAAAATTTTTTDDCVTAWPPHYTAIASQGIIRVLDVMTSPPNTTDFTDVYIVCPLMESDLERIISSDQPLSEVNT